MAFVSGGSAGGGGGGGMPPQQQQQQGGVNQQLLDMILQQQQQQASGNSQSSLVSQLLASALLGGGGGALGVGALGNQLAAAVAAASPLGSVTNSPALSQHQQQPQPVQNQVQQQQHLLMSALQSQLALSQLMPQIQNPTTLNPLLSMNLYYQQLLQQQQQHQQQQQLLQQLQQQQHQQQQQQQLHHSQPSVSNSQQSLQLNSQQSHSAFQPPQQSSTGGSVESQLNAQERLMNLMSIAGAVNASAVGGGAAVGGTGDSNDHPHPFAIGIARRDTDPHMAPQQQQLMHSQSQQHQQASAASSSSTGSNTHERVAARNSSNLNPKEVHDHINRIISENEAIVQPQEPLMKRRPYHRQVGQQSSIDQDSNNSSTRTSPGIRDIRMLQAAGRTQSLYEPINGVRAFGGSLTSGQPLIRHNFQQPPICTYCHVAFPNEAGLAVHEQRCSKRLEEKTRTEAAAAAPAAPAPAAPVVPAEQPPVVNNSSHPLKRRLLMAAVHDDPPPNPKLSRNDSNEIIVVGETKAPERKEPVDYYNHPGLPRRATIATISMAASSSTAAAGPSNAAQPAPPPSLISPTQISNALAGQHSTAFTHVTPARNQQTQLQQQAQQLLHQHLLQQHQQLQQQVQQQKQQQQAAAAQVAQVVPVAPAVAAPLPPPAPVAAPASGPIQQQQQPVQIQMNVSQFAPSASASSSSATSATLPALIPGKSDEGKQSEERDAEPFSIKDLTQTGALDKPYTLVLSEGSRGANTNTDVLKNSRNRGRNITSETFVCMHRAQPMFVEQKGNLSMYSNWHQVTVSETESRLNLLFMGMCSAKPRTGIHPFWRYSVANRELGNFKMTHSSFWAISQSLRSRQLAEAAEAEGGMKTEEAAGSSSDIVNMEVHPMKIEADEMLEDKPDVSTSAVEVKMDVDDDEKSHSFREPVKRNSSDIDVDIGEFDFKPSPRHAKKTDPVGGHRTDEVYVYVRGRGRGRYVCDRCGIRCKKPSMLKKHIKSHTDVRPYKCKQCNFSFKTKGNLTKHLGSKTHRRRIQNGGDDSDSEGRLEIASPDDDDMAEDAGMIDRRRFDDDDICSSDEEDDHMKIIEEMEDNPFKRFGQENILFERSAHTPPSRWVMVDDELASFWPESECHRQCSSAPPSAMPSPHKENEEQRQEPALAVPPMLFSSSSAGPSSSTLSSTAYPTQPHLPPRFGATAAAAPIGVAPPNNMIYSYIAKEEASLKCDQCDRTFRKASELSCHQHVHNIEKQQQKSRMFQCPDCKIPIRTKSLLAKHVEQVHGSHIDDSVTANVDPSASTQSVLGGGATPVANNPRSFMCSDCNIGFRKHGILAKHLRSKTHVMKLETLRRLPEDSLSLITKRDNGACLNEVDTTDCEKARTSLIAIVDAIRAENQRNQLAAISSNGSSSSSLECREQLTASPVPPPLQLPIPGSSLTGNSAPPVIARLQMIDSPVSNGLSAPRCYSENSSPFRSRCGSAASGVDVAAAAATRKRSDSSAILRPDVAALTAAAAGSMGKVVSANVWVPPKPAEQERNGHSRLDHLMVGGPLRSVHDDIVEMTKDDADGAGALLGQDLRSSPLLRILAAGEHRSSAVSLSTRCTICEVNYDTPVDLQVHLCTDHISMRDGTYFKCPKRFCGKVYPNKDCLRVHISAHYKTIDTAGADVREDDSVSSSASLAFAGRPDEQPASPMSDATDSTCQSPANIDVPRTVSSVESRTPSEEPLRLPCSLCQKVFTDAATLQQHWFGHVSSRTHVCQVCDAGFTTQEALTIHAASHNEMPKHVNGIS